MELIGQSVAVLRVDENDGHCGRDAGHHGQEVRQTVLLLQLVETDVGVGGLSSSYVHPVDGAKGLVEGAKAVVEVVTLHLRNRLDPQLQTYRYSNNIINDCHIHA